LLIQVNQSNNQESSGKSLLTNLVCVVDWKVEIVNDRGQSFGGALSHANILVADEPDQNFQKSFLKIKPIESLTDINK
jgi:hypothetical protein